METGEYIIFEKKQSFGVQIMVEQENNERINESKNNWFGTVLDAITIAPIALAVFIGGIWLLIKVIGRFMPYWFSGFAGPVTVLGFDILLFVIMRWWRPRSGQLKALKKLLFVILFSFSASILAVWFIGYITQDMW